MARLGRSFPRRRLTLLRPDFLLLGGGAATASGATVTLNASLIAGSATGASSAAAATVSQAASLVSGAATGAASAAAATVTEQEALATAGAATGAAARAGVTVTEQGSLVAGSGTGAATAAAATVSLNTSAIAGAATGAAAASTATVSLNTSLIAGAAVGAASAAGATVTEALSLTAGAASGGGVGTAAGATVTETTALSLGLGRNVIPVGFPTAATTGVRSGVTLTSTGDMTVTTNNAVISGYHISGTLRIEANNVTVQDCLITDWGFYGVLIPAEYTGAVVEYCDIIGIGGTNGIGGTGTFRYNDISQSENGIMLFGPCLIENNYIHGLYAVPENLEPHFDGIQLGGGDGVTIRHNTVINDFTQTSAIALFSDFSPITGVLVENNFISGGGYTIYAEGVTSVLNNIIGKGGFGWANVTGTITAWTNNIDVATWRYVDSGNALGANAPLATGEALAAGATVTESASLIAGSASAAGAPGTASGVTVTEAASLTAGSAAGGVGASGATVTLTASFIAGTRTGAGLAAGATVTDTASLLPGAAFGPLPTAAVAPPPRPSFDLTTPRWDSTAATFDQDSTTVFTVSASLIPGTAVTATGATGKTFTTAFSLIAGAAVADIAPVATGKTFTSVTALVTGAASSSEPATVSGAELTVQSSLIAGTATGAVTTSGGIRFDQMLPTWDAMGVTFDATAGGAPPALFIGQPTYTFIPGAATAIAGAPGVTFETRMSFMGSPANVLNAPGTAQGAALTVVVSLVPGAARGQGWSRLPEDGAAWTGVEKPSDGWTIAPRPGGAWNKAA